MSVTLFHGDCLDVLPALPDASMDSIVTDPPGGISFMGKKWDHDRGGRDQWIAWMTQVASEALRVLKPGGHALVWALPRTSHWTVTAWEDAGFEVRDRLAHVFGSGFPKSHDISKAIDKAAGAERKVVGTKRGTRGADGTGHEGAMPGKATGIKQTGCDVPITAPATSAAAEWDGWGTALKPAMEDWWLLRKPLAEVSSEELFAATKGDFWHTEQAITHHGRKIARHTYKALHPGVQSYVKLIDGEDVIECTVTGEYEPFIVNAVAANVLRWGTGGINVDGGRIGMGGEYDPSKVQRQQRSDGAVQFGSAGLIGTEIPTYNSAGRWPSNLILDGEAGRLLDAQSGERPGCSVSSLGQYKSRSGFGGGQINCAYGDTGGASRFFQRCDWDEADVACCLCGLPREDEHTCDVNSAAASLSQTTRDSGSVTGHVPPNGQPRNEASKGLSPTPASSVDASSQTLPETSASTALSNVRLTATEQNARAARFAGSLCASCAIAIAQSVVATSPEDALELLLGAASIPGHKRQILSQSLALFAESQGSSDTIPTIASLRLLFGYVRDAMQNSIPTDARESEHAQTRFLYQSKASRKERNAGLEGFEERQRDLSRNPEQKAMNGGDGNPYNRGCTPLQNNHPTVKPLALMRYFVRLVTPPGGVVLDMFMGSGTTGMAARLEGFGFVGIEMERESYDIAEARIAWADERAATVAIEPMPLSFVGD